MADSLPPEAFRWHTKPKGSVGKTAPRNRTKPRLRVGSVFNASMAVEVAWPTHFG